MAAAITDDALAETSVGGLIVTNTVWTQVGSPYVVEDGIMVVNDATLTIEPGVEIRFQPGTRLEIAEGELRARGTADDMILFTKNETSPGPGWQQICFMNGAVDATFNGNGDYTEGSIIEYAVIEFAGTWWDYGAIHISSSSPFISRNIIRNNANGAIYARGAHNLRLSANEITHNSPSVADIIYLDNSDRVTLTNNRIRDNLTSSCWTGHAAVRLEYSDYFVAIGNRIVGNDAYGILFNGDSGYASLSLDPSNPNHLHGNAGYDIYVNQGRGGHSINDYGNVDARHVYWGTGDAACIASRICDFFDYTSMGIVFYEPWANLPGDADLDGDVDLEDFHILKTNFGTGTTWAEGDFDEDGDVDLDDFYILKINFGATGNR